MSEPYRWVVAGIAMCFIAAVPATVLYCSIEPERWRRVVYHYALYVGALGVTALLVATEVLLLNWVHPI